MAIDQFKTVDIVITNINEDYIPQQSAVQGERSGRSLTLQITNGGKIENQAGVSVNLGWSHDTVKNNDGEKLQGLDAFQAIDKTKGLFRLDYPASMMQPGQITAVIQVLSSDSDTRSKPFKIKVEKTPFDNEAAESENSFTALQEALGTVNKYDGKIGNLEFNKADKAELVNVENKVNNLGSATPKETFSSLDALQSKYPSGSNFSMVVLESDGKTGFIYLWDGNNWQKGALYQAQGLNLESVDLTKTTFSLQTENLFDVYLSENGRYPVWNTGKLQENAIFSASDFIPVEQGKTYIKSDTQQVAFYGDKSISSFISGIATVQNKSFTVPSNVKYVRLAVLNSLKSDYMFVEGQELPAKYIPARLIDGDYVDPNLIEKQLSTKTNIIGNDAIKNDAIGLDKISFAEKSLNKFDKTAIEKNKYPVWNTGKLQENMDFSASDFIPVEEGKLYSKSDTQQIAFYRDRDITTFISGVSKTDGNQFVVPIGTNIAYVRLAVKNTDLEKYMLVEGSTLPGQFVPYMKYIKTEALDPEFVNKVNYIPTVTQRIIDSKGRYDYKTIQEFVDNEDTSKIQGYILDGEYEEQLELQNKKIILKGESKSGVIIYNTDGRYAKPPINFGWGILENLSIYARYIQGVSNEIDGNTTGAYGIHLDSPYAAGKSIELRNLKVVSDFFPAIGCGLRKDCLIEISDSYLKNGQVRGRGGYSSTGTLGALYIHDDNNSGPQINQKLAAKNLMLESNLENSLCIYDLSKDGSNAELTVVNNLLYSHLTGKENNNIWFRGKDAWTGTFSLNGLSYGNSNRILNL